MKPKICVIGSSNIDQFSYVSDIPADGETVFGDSYETGFGGKGANQAIMAGLLGAETVMITCLGSDIFAESTIENYKNNGVNVDFIQRVDGSSGVAPIWVDSTGQNRIIVIPGANNFIDADKAISSIKQIDDLSVLVGQCEIPMEVNQKVFEFANNQNITTIFNPAPAQKLDQNLLKHVNWLIPNENEFEVISDMELNDENLIKFKNDITCELIVTLGEKGAALVGENNISYFEAPEVNAVDTTGAGDAFIGAFAFGLSSSKSVDESIKLAVERASLSVTKKGTQSSYLN